MNFATRDIKYGFGSVEIHLVQYSVGTPLYTHIADIPFPPDSIQTSDFPRDCVQKRGNGESGCLLKKEEKPLGEVGQITWRKELRFISHAIERYNRGRISLD